LGLKTLGLFDGSLQIRGGCQGLDPGDQFLLVPLIGVPFNAETVIEPLERGAKAPFQAALVAVFHLAEMLPALAHLTLGALGLSPIDASPIDLVEKCLELGAEGLAGGAGGLALSGPLFQPGLAEGMDPIGGGGKAFPEGVIGRGAITLQFLPLLPQFLQTAGLGGEREVHGFKFLHGLTEAFAMGVRAPAPPLLQVAQRAGSGPEDAP
jgi:hypothetical protein